MPALLERLNQDHKHLALVLDLLDTLLDLFHEGQEPDYELICEMLEYMENYEDQVHHPSEDLIFERMKARGSHHPVAARTPVRAIPEFAQPPVPHPRASGLSRQGGDRDRLFHLRSDR